HARFVVRRNRRHTRMFQRDGGVAAEPRPQGSGAPSATPGRSGGVGIVAERHAGVGMAPWLEMELARQLSPVAAPESLWDRIHVDHVQPVPRRADGFRWELWPVAAALLLLASGGVIWQADPLADMEKLAAQKLHEF